MSYVVLTLVPRLHVRPKPGESLATGIREEGCKRCRILYTGKLDPCWEHKDDHILWAEKEDDDANVEMADKASDVHLLGSPKRVEEPVEVP